MSLALCWWQPWCQPLLAYDVSRCCGWGNGTARGLYPPRPPVRRSSGETGEKLVDGRNPFNTAINLARITLSSLRTYDAEARAFISKRQLQLRTAYIGSAEEPLSSQLIRRRDEQKSLKTIPKHNHHLPQRSSIGAWTTYHTTRQNHGRWRSLCLLEASIIIQFAFIRPFRWNC